MNRHRGGHLAQRGGEQSRGILAAGDKHITLGGADGLVTGQGETLHILINEFTNLVIAQDARRHRCITGHVNAMFLKGDARQLVVLLADGLDHPSGRYATGSPLHRPIDDFASHEHLGRATGIHIDHVVDVGAHLLQNLAGVACGTADGLAV